LGLGSTASQERHEEQVQKSDQQSVLSHVYVSFLLRSTESEHFFLVFFTLNAECCFVHLLPSACSQRLTHGGRRLARANCLGALGDLAHTGFFGR
jgi:hypothetical protein